MAGSPNKIDSNFTGLRVAEEVFGNIGILPGEDGNPGSPTWYEWEPNSYSDFGGQISMVARTPITANRQRKKGIITDLDATAGVNVDFTQDNIYDVLQGFFFADWRASTVVGGEGEITGVDGAGNGFEAAAGFDSFAAGDIVFSSGFASLANNGRHIVSSATATDLVVSSTLVAEVPGASVEIRKVGVQGAAGDFVVDVTGDLPAIASTAYDFTTLGIVPGAWIFIGGDLSTSAFASSNNNGIARVRSVTANRIELDKTQNAMTADTGAGKQVEIYVSVLIRNENDPELIKCRSYQFERSLSSAGFEYVKGAVPNTLTFNVATADKINVDMAFVGTDVDPREVVDRKPGSFPTLATNSTAFNTSSDFSRIRTAEDGAATPLFAFITDLTLTINNNISPAKAVGRLGAFSMNVGDFVAEGNVTAYFSDIDSIKAVRENANVTIDFFLAKENAGWVFDIPLLSLGEGRLNVEKDSPVTLPVSLAGAQDYNYNTTLQAAHFAYLPSRAHG